MARHVRWNGRAGVGLRARCTRMPIDRGVHAPDRVLPARRAGQPRAEHKGWKIPETTLVYPWIVRMFPDIKYIFWIRDPRDCIIGGAPDRRPGRLRRRRIRRPTTCGCGAPSAGSTSTTSSRPRPRPAHWIEVRFEDFVLRQEETLARLEAFLGFPLARIPVQPGPVGRWKTDAGTSTTSISSSQAMQQNYGYETAATADAGREGRRTTC